MDIAAKEQKWKRDTIEKMYDAGFYQTAKSNFHHGLKNFYTTIGYVGLWETIQILTGDEDSFAAGDNLELARKVMQFMADRCQSYYEQGLGMVNFEATPAEAAAHKLALKAIKMPPTFPGRGEATCPTSATPATCPRACRATCRWPSSRSTSCSPSTPAARCTATTPAKT